MADIEKALVPPIVRTIEKVGPLLEKALEKAYQRVGVHLHEAVDGIAKTDAERVEGGVRLPDPKPVDEHGGGGADGAAGGGDGSSNTAPRTDGRDEKGHFTGKDGVRPGKDVEAATLDDFEQALGKPVERRQVKATIPGHPHGRFYDGLWKKDDDTWEAVEVKMNRSSDAQQNAFDGLVRSGTTATATLDGKVIKITSVVVRRVTT